MVRKGNAEPKIKGFSLIGFSGEDSTDAVLNAPLALVLFCNEVNVDGWINNFRDVVAEAQQKNIPVYAASMPSGMPMTTASSMAANARIMVPGNASRSTSLTGLRV